MLPKQRLKFTLPHKEIPSLKPRTQVSYSSQVFGDSVTVLLHI